MDSLRSQTGRIRHLDAARAAQLVTLFARPVSDTAPDLGYDRDDPVAGSSCGWLTLHSAAGRDGRSDAVGHYATHLYLHELLRLPLSVARPLARHRGHLYLDKLVRVTDAAAAELARHVGGGLSLNNLRRLSVTQAHELGRHEHELSFERIRRLGLGQARGLARHGNQLHLGGLEQLRPREAAALACHRGDLFIGGLRHLPARVAAHLAHHQGKLHFHGLERLGTAAARGLAARQGYLCLRDVRTLTPAQAGLLARHVGVLQLGGLAIDERIAENLGDHAGSLVVSLDDTCSHHTLAAILRHRGPVHLGGLETIDVARAGLLAGQCRANGVGGLDGLFLPGVKQLTAPAAAILAAHQGGGLSLGGIELLTEAVANQLVRHPLLELDGVKRVTDRVAAILATHDGGVLSLRGLESASGRGLALLWDNPDVILPPRLARPEPTTACTTARSGGHPSPAKLEQIIAGIAAAGEAQLAG
jgi:hypothetical protein